MDNEFTVWIRLCQNGDKKAFENIYRMFVSVVYALSLRLTCRTVQAEELTQDVFIQVWKKLKKLKEPEAFPKWIKRITLNCFFSGIRYRKRQQLLLEEAEEYADFLRKRVYPREDERLELEMALAKLPERARTVLILHELEGFKHQEISEMMEITVGASKSQLARARELLKEALR